MPAQNAFSSQPALQYGSHAIDLSADYRLNRSTTKFAVAYANLTSEDGALDGVDPNRMDQLLTSGNDRENYDIFALMIGVKYRF